MNLSEPFIRRPVMTILLVLSTLLFGLASYQNLPVSDLPSVELPTIQVSVSYPGASPETMANSVSTPLEQQFMTIEGLQSVFSSSSTGSSSIVLQFELGRNLDGASNDVQAAISRAQPNLPSDLPNNPTYRKVNPAATPILYYVFTSSAMPLSELYDYANTFIGQRLSMVDGVSQVITYGFPYAVRVQVDPEKLAAKNIGLDEIAATLRRGNVDLPLGTLNSPETSFTLQADGQLMRAPAYGELIVKNEAGELVKLSQVGRALDSVQNDKSFMHYVTREADDPCIVLAIQKQPGKNAVQVVDGVDAMLKSLAPTLPPSLSITPVYNQADSILAAVHEVKITLGIAFLLVLLIVYLFLGKLVDTLIPSMSLPLSIAGAFGLMWLFGFSVDLLSLLAITLSIGFLVDDAIVVLENTARHVQSGTPRFEAALQSAREISVTVLSITLCLIAAFIPMVFMGGVVGMLFREFALTLIAIVTLSGVISLTLTPMLCSRLIALHKEPKASSLRQLYERILQQAMRKKPLLIALGTLSIALSLLLFKHLPTDFLPPEDAGFLRGFTVSRDGTSPFAMEAHHETVSKLLIDDPNVESVVSISSYGNPNEGILFVHLKPLHERLPMEQAIAHLTEKLQKVPGINTYLSPIPLINLQVGSTAQALYQYSLSSLDPTSLYTYAPLLLAEMEKAPPFAQVSSDLRDLQPQWKLKLLREKASNFDISAAAIEGFLSYAYSENKISQINAPINQYDVLLETLPRFYKDPSVLSKLYVRSETNYLVPLSELVEVEETVGPLTINHLNGIPTVGLSFNLSPGTPLGTAVSTLHTLTHDHLPPQISGHLLGTADVFKDAFSSLKLLFLLSFFVIYVILGILYESFIHPLTVMSALPPALLGGLATLYVTHETLSLYSFVGLTLLMGIVLKNGVLIIDFALEKQRSGSSPERSIIEASLLRLRPILMTTLAAMMGAVPIALGVGGAVAASYRSLGLCILGGLMLSQLLTLVLTPVLYVYFEEVREWGMAKWGGKGEKG